MSNTTEYINTVDYKRMATKIKDLTGVMEELTMRSKASRDLRYSEVDVEREKGAGHLSADELFIPQRIIDTNIRREQSSYVQYVTQSPRAVVLKDKMTPAVDPALLEMDVTNRLRYDGWQLALYPCIDGMQQNGYGVMEIVYDESKPGHVCHEFVQLGDFGFVSDTRNIQETELVGRYYYFSRTKLLALADKAGSDWNKEQILKIVGSQPKEDTGIEMDYKDRSLYRITKVMFRIKGIVHVAWTRDDMCDDWIRRPKQLVLGRRMDNPAPTMVSMLKSKLSGIPDTVSAPETDYPYVLFPYLISENDTISMLKGRVFLDQDCQEAATSLVTSLCTSVRRASNMYFSKDTDDPNADMMMQKNIYFEPGALINGKVKQFQLTPIDSEILQVIQAIKAENQNETSQVNFAAMNRQDSRKTATEITAASQSAAALSTVQVVLFSWALRNMYSTMFLIIQSRVLAGLIKDVDPQVKPMYARQYQIKPSGDTDVIERQQLVQAMGMAWPIMQATAAGPVFLCDMLQKMFPEQSQRYITIIEQAAQQQQAQQQQMQQSGIMQMLQVVQQAAKGIVSLSDHPEFFSDTGRIHAYPVVQEAASKIEEMQQAMQKQQTQQPQQQPQLGNG